MEMFSEKEVKELIDNEANIVYINDFKGNLRYYGIPSRLLSSIFNKIYKMGFEDGFVQGSGNFIDGEK